MSKMRYVKLDFTDAKEKVEKGEYDETTGEFIPDKDDKPEIKKTNAEHYSDGCTNDM